MDENATAAAPADEVIGVPDTASAPDTVAEDVGQDIDGEDSSDELDALLTEATGTAEEGDNSELVDIEYDGETYKLPPKLKDALLRQADYTKKTMEVAEQRKEIAATKERVDALANLQTEQLGVVFQAEQARARLQQLAQTPIGGLSQEEINSLRLDYRDTEQQVAQLTQHAANMISQEQQARAQQAAKAREDCIKAASKQVPNFTDQRRTELETLAISMGATPEDIADVTHPVVYKLLHLADIGQKFIDRQRKTSRVEQAQATTPVPVVGGNKATATKDPDKMSTEEWMKWRNKQLSR